MRSSFRVLLLGLGACSIDPIEINLDPVGGSVVLYDDGAVVRVAGCPNRGFLGCEQPQPGDTMTVTADGTTYDVSQDHDGWIDDQMLGLFRDGPFQLTFPRPANGIVDITLSGTATSVRLPDGFAVTPPPAHVMRSDGPIAIEHEMLPGATAQALAIAKCGNTTRNDVFDDSEPGSVEVAFDGITAAGACSHEIHIDQTLTLESPSFAVTGVRIERVALTSDP